MKKKRARGKLTRVVSEQFPVSAKRGGGIIKVEAWENYRGEVVKYSLAYINHLLFADDNGRVLGYDNTHAYHHRHNFGEISEITDFKDYQELVARFEHELKEFIK